MCFVNKINKLMSHFCKLSINVMPYHNANSHNTTTKVHNSGKHEYKYYKNTFGKDDRTGLYRKI